MPEFDRLLLFHALRPDRLTASMAKFVANTLGKRVWQLWLTAAVMVQGGRARNYGVSCAHERTF